MTLFSKKNAAVLLAGSAMSCLVAIPAHAQSADNAAAGEAEFQPTNEIVVIARKREERLLDVPIAITALGQEQLDDLGANDLSGVQGATPNVNVVQGRGSASSANFFIRGIGQPDALQTFDPAVGVYIDGVYLSRIQGALLNLYDVERVEVLRGPQGTLYGKNTIGGAVNIVSKKPDLDYMTGEASFTYGKYDETIAKGYISAPIAPGSVALSLAGLYDNRDGIVTDPATGKKYNDRNNLSFRGILRAQPSDAVEVLLSGDYTRQRNKLTLGCATTDLIGFDYNATFTGLTPFVIAPNSDCDNYDYEASTSFTGDEGQKLEHWGVSGTVNVELSDMLTLSSITAYRKLTPDLFIDIDATDTEVGDVFVGVNQKQFSQELQLKLDADRLAGVFGLYYLNEQITSQQTAWADNYLRYIGTPLEFIRTIEDDQELDSYAAFGQLTYDFTDKFSMTAGLRYTHEKKSYYRHTDALLSSAVFQTDILASSYTFPDDLPAPFNDIDSVSFDAWTPMVSASYKPTANTMIYASASRGFKSGGFNGRVNGLADVTLEVDGDTVVVPYFAPEKVWTYEVGAKGSWLDGRVNVSVAAFHSDYKDFQARVGGGNTGVTGGSFPVLNAGKLTIQGIEVEGSVKPSTPLTIMASVGYLNAKYDEFTDGRRAPAFSCNPTGNAVTCEPAFAPPLTARVGMDYTVPVGDDASLSFGGDMRFVDKHYLSVDNREGLEEDGYYLGNVYAEIDWGGYYLRGMVKNVTNSLYKTDGQEFSSVGNIQTVYFGDPRTWQVTAGFRF
ncbi:Outer membrane receptor protein, mostly Fe transport [Altererythrobacter epoxidivorans]|uniref:Outer membrane receptor protein, mostly Fe transport n=1 Tax=Altererythrobacter epoxidivorans TaxID=361183 RepID=A0A0M4LXK8_9SPHN|nr:Outer membrane receptor protein, mostly Fe transport [Altererythrobacter epoxidivorans]